MIIKTEIVTTFGCDFCNKEMQVVNRGRFESKPAETKYSLIINGVEYHWCSRKCATDNFNQNLDAMERKTK